VANSVGYLELGGWRRLAQIASRNYSIFPKTIRTFPLPGQAPHAPTGAILLHLLW